MDDQEPVVESQPAVEEESEQRDEPVVVVEATPVLFQTTVRERVTPFLPPPVIQAIHTVDPVLEPYVGPEASVTVVGSLLVGVLVWQVLKILSNISGRGRAIVDDEDEAILTSTKQEVAYGDTVLLCGPPGAGKTRLFYTLCYGSSQVSTVTSLKANIGFISPDTNNDEATTVKPTRFMDYPGHASWDSPQLLSVLKSISRLVLVLDSTQPVAPAADVLYQILSFSSTDKISGVPTVFVACHKVDAPHAKNWRRMKIQLRTELERLLKVKSATETNEQPWWPPGKPLDLDQVEGAKLVFGSTSCEGDQQGMEDLKRFVVSGEIPQKSKTPQIRRV